MECTSLVYLFFKETFAEKTSYKMQKLPFQRPQKSCSQEINNYNTATPSFCIWVWGADYFFMVQKEVPVHCS